MRAAIHSFPQYIFMEWYLVKPRDFTLHADDAVDCKKYHSNIDIYKVNKCNACERH
jgi:hypothetical protein